MVEHLHPCTGLGICEPSADDDRHKLLLKMNSNNDILEVLLPQNQQDDTLISTTSSPVQASRATSADEASQEPLSGHQDLNVDEAPLTLVFDQLNLREETRMAERMFLSLGVIIQHATEEFELDIDVQEVQDALRHADQISRNGNRDVEALAKIQAVLAQLLLLQDSNHLVEAAIILANASRDGKSVASYSFVQAENGRVLEITFRTIGSPSFVPAYPGNNRCGGSCPHSVS